MQIKILANPLSSNNAYANVRGFRRWKTVKHISYRDIVGWQLKGLEKIEGHIEIGYKFYVRNCRGRDVDNMVKPLQDCLVENGIIDDDINVYKITAEKILISKDEKDHIEIEIKKYNGNKTN